MPIRNELPNVIKERPNQIKLTVQISIANTFKILIFQNGFPAMEGNGKPKTPDNAAYTKKTMINISIKTFLSGFSRLNAFIPFRRSITALT